MATLSINWFYVYPENFAEGVHDLGSDTLKLMLTNTAPVATNTVFANITDITAGNGYTAGGETVTITSSTQTAGTYALVIDGDIVWTASGGSIGPFRYYVLYNDTPTAPAKPLIAYWDIGSSVTVDDGANQTAAIDGVTLLGFEAGT